MADHSRLISLCYLNVNVATGDMIDDSRRRCIQRMVVTYNQPVNPFPFSQSQIYFEDFQQIVLPKVSQVTAIKSEHGL